MSMAVAPVPAPLANTIITIPSTTPPSQKSINSNHNSSSPTTSDIRLRNSSSDSKKSPNTNRPASIPKVVIKQEPTSPEVPPTARHRPRRLDLSNHNKPIVPGALSSRPLTSKDSTLALHDVSLACLSPGFNTTDPAMQQQLQRSMNVRDQQRLIIEARQKGQNKTNGEQDLTKNGADALFRPNKMPNTSRRKGPPPALSIAPPSHAQFANERVIQSAPLGASFTGLNRLEAAHMRQVVNHPSKLSHSSHIHHVPAIQTSNRLPPIADVFPGELQSNGQLRKPSNYALSPGATQQPLPSPGYPPQFQAQHNLQQQEARREYKTAEEAVRSITGGREELMPRLVHYGGHQPPTPPSPDSRHAKPVSAEQQVLTQVVPNPHCPPKITRTVVPHSVSTGSIPLSATTARRRDRDEYEKDNGSPPLGRGPAVRRSFIHPQTSGRDLSSSTSGYNGPRDSPEEHARKKEKFMKLMEEAWDLFHT